jgi:hypothetical protein
MTKNLLPLPFSHGKALTGSMNILSTEKQIALEGSLDIPADETGRQSARQWAAWWSRSAAAIQEDLLPEAGMNQGGPMNAPDTIRSPFADVSFGVDELIVDCASDRIALYGHLGIKKNQEGRDVARRMARFFQSIVVELDRRAERGDLPDVIPIIAPIRKPNPLA